MTAPLPAGEPSVPEDRIPLPPPPTPLPTAVPSRRRLRLLLSALVLLAATAAGVWWWTHRASEAADVPLPAEIHDPEVRRAIERARQKVLEAPKDADAWGHLGMVYHAHLFDREASLCYAQADLLNPWDPRWSYGQGVLAFRRAMPQAEPLLRRAVAAAAGRPDYRSPLRLQLAEVLMDHGETDEAEKIFLQEWQSHENNPRAGFGLGLLALARGDDAAARDYLLAARASPYAHKKAAAQLAAVARRTGDKEAAARYEKEAADLPDDPPWPDPLRDRVIELRVGDRGMERKVILLEQQHRFAEAADLWLLQLHSDPTPKAYIGAGLNLARLNDYERGLPLLREAIRRDPANPRAYYTLALALLTRAEKERTRSPDSAEVKEWFAEAARHAERAAELKPDYGAAYLNWGVALKYLGRFADAAAPLRRGVAAHPENFELQLALGQVLLELGQNKEAETHLDNARRLDPADERPAEALRRLHPKKK